MKPHVLLCWAGGWLATGGMLLALDGCGQSPQKIQPQKAAATPVHQPIAQMSVELGGKIVLDLVWIPPGEFLMGSSENEKDRWDNERPQHRVTISKGFWMGKYEVTQQQWEGVMGSNPARHKGAKLPVEQVNWYDCCDFIDKLNVLAWRFQRGSHAVANGIVVQPKASPHPSGSTESIAALEVSSAYHFALPTEAQWEYACRAGTRTHFYTGDKDSDLARAGWFSGNSAGKTHEVGQKEANAWGLYDMHGNVCECCQDWKGDYRSKAVTDPVGPRSGYFKIIRGGAFSTETINCWSTMRDSFEPNTNIRGDFVGLRVVLILR